MGRYERSHDGDTFRGFLTKRHMRNLETRLFSCVSQLADSVY